jgi:hypothetical protein
MILACTIFVGLVFLICLIAYVKTGQIHWIPILIIQAALFCFELFILLGGNHG